MSDGLVPLLGGAQNIRNVGSGKLDPLQVPGARLLKSSASDFPWFQRTGPFPVQMLVFDKWPYAKLLFLKDGVRGGEELDCMPRWLSLNIDGAIGNGLADI